MLLAIDSATRTLSIALHDGQQIIAENTWRSANRHTVELTPAVAALMKHVGASPADLSAVAVMRGPGSFTGLRIGMSVAKGLALSADPPLPLIGIPTLDVTAAAQPHILDDLWSISQAGRGRINAGLYTWPGGTWQAVDAALLLTWADLIERIEKPVQIAGEIDAHGREQLAPLGERVILSSPAQALRRAGFLAELAYRRFEAGQTDDPAALAPQYLHD